MKPSGSDPAPSLELRGQRLCIPNLGPVFASWKQGVNPLHGRVKQAVDVRLERLLGDDGDGQVLTKIKAADLGLFASGLFPDAPYPVLETAAFYCVWLFLWDDVIDGAAAPAASSSPEDHDGDSSDGAGGLAAAERYCRRSVAFVRHHLLGSVDGRGEAEPAAPTKVCGSFAEVARRLGELCGGVEERAELFGRLREYMEACVTECRWRWSWKVPTAGEFYSWRLRTSSVDVMLVLARILNGISLPEHVLKSKELATMGLSVNKLLIMINELFSLKKELKDGAHTNLIPITMHELGLDLASAVQQVVDDIHNCVRDFDNNASDLREAVASEHREDIVDGLSRLIEAYQAIATSVFNFSSQSPRYGILRDRRGDGSFMVVL